MISVKSLLPSTLFGRSLLIMVTPVLLIQIIAAYIFFDRHWSRMMERLAYAVAGEIAIISDRIEENTDPEYIKRMASISARNLGLLISFEPGTTFAPENVEYESLIMRKLSASLQEQVRRPFAITTDLKEKWIEIRIGLENGTLNVSTPQRRLFSSSGYIFLLWMIISSIILLAIAVVFMRNQIRPIRRLAVAAERIGKGRNLPSTFKPEGAREVRQAAQAFIDMHDRIKRQMAQRTAMLAGVSHDLRTPLTRIRLQLAMLGSTPDTEAMKSDIHDMELMLNAYLDFVRGEGGEASAHTDLSVMLERVAQSARRTGMPVETDIAGDLSLSVRPLAIERCFNNIIGNAKKFAKHAWISAQHHEDETITIIFEDDGPGIPDDQVEEVFKPFVRLEKSRNQSTGGVGLGLSITQDIIHSHGGQIKMERSSKGGLRVVVSLPV